MKHQCLYSLQGIIDKYTWQDIGSSYLPGELVAAFLWAQLESAKEITEQRITSWEIYNKMLEPLEEYEGRSNGVRDIKILVDAVKLLNKRIHHDIKVFSISQKSRGLRSK